ncbi:hypothetical protein B7463_g1487, partial [Scytalidium lignicola]
MVENIRNLRDIGIHVQQFHRAAGFQFVGVSARGASAKPHSPVPNAASTSAQGSLRPEPSPEHEYGTLILRTIRCQSTPWKPQLLSIDAHPSTDMTTKGGDFAVPVKAILTAYDRGIKLADKASKSAGEGSTPDALQISESTDSLKRALEKSNEAVIKTYQQCVAKCGQPFTQALVEDKAIQSELKEFKNELNEQIVECSVSSFDDLESLSAGFTNLEEQVWQSCTECIAIFERLQSRLAPRAIPKLNANDQAQLSNKTTQNTEQQQQQQQPSSSGGPSQSQDASRSTRKPSPPLQIPEPQMTAPPPKPKGPWTITNSPFSNISTSGSPSLSPSQPNSYNDISPLGDGPTPRLIPKELVDHQISANNNWLERRRQSRLVWQNELRKSGSSFDDNRVSVAISDNSAVQSPIIGPSMVSSPVDYRAPRNSGHDLLVTRQPSQTSQGTRSSNASSYAPERSRHDSQESIFGNRVAAPLSPPLSAKHDSGASRPHSRADHAGPSRRPAQNDTNYGLGIEAGLEVVHDYSQGLIAIEGQNPIQQPRTPTASVRTIDHPITPSSSFYKFEGFCEGARAMMRGEVGFRQVRKPAGQFSATMSARCKHCAFEVGWTHIERDSTLNPAGIYMNDEIRFRQQFLSKCHVKTKSIDEPLYACVFCVEENRTIEAHDATIFFTVTQLFQHLSHHSRPVPAVSGLRILYGNHPPSVVDFDIHFMNNTATTAEFCMAEIAAKVASRPTAIAVNTYRPKPGSRTYRDPDGYVSLPFAAGAKIVGITFPDKFEGKWCTGYHDGLRGSFPFSEISLEMPIREDMVVQAQSNLTAVTKWEFKQKDTKDGGWLSFKKGDTITSIGYIFQDQWCWSGKNSKGKWGMFPSAFVEGLREGAASNVGLSSSPSSFKHGSFGSRMPSFPIRNRSGSKTENRAPSSASRGQTSPSQPGLEVVPSRSSWRMGDCS